MKMGMFRSHPNEVITMRSATTGRVAALCLALLPATARAGDLHWPKLCPDKKSCETDRVTLPAQLVEIRTSRPQVTIREVAPAREVAARSMRHHAVAATPVGMIYMPVALPQLAAFPAVGAAPCHDSNPLTEAHAAETAQLHSEHAKAKLQATIDAHNRVMARITGSKPSGGDQSEIQKRLDELKTQLTELNTRVTSVEKLLIIHDNIIQEKLLAAEKKPEIIAPPVSVVPTTPTTVPMLPPIPNVPNR